VTDLQSSLAGQLRFALTLYRGANTKRFLDRRFAFGVCNPIQNVLFAVPSSKDCYTTIVPVVSNPVFDLLLMIMLNV